MILTPSRVIKRLASLAAAAGAAGAAGLVASVGLAAGAAVGLGAAGAQAAVRSASSKHSGGAVRRSQRAMVPSRGAWWIDRPGASFPESDHRSAAGRCQPADPPAAVTARRLRVAQGIYNPNDDERGGRGAGEPAGAGAAGGGAAGGGGGGGG